MQISKGRIEAIGSFWRELVSYIAVHQKCLKSVFVHQNPHFIFSRDVCYQFELVYLAVLFYFNIILPLCIIFNVLR